MPRLPSTLLILLALLGMTTGPGDAQSQADKETEGQKTLWGALIYAVANEEEKKEGFDPPSKDLNKRLGKAFPKYTHFQLLGENSEALFKNTYSWVAPSKEVCVKFDSKGLTKEGDIKLDLQLWSQDKALIKTDAILKPGSPVFIEGPAWGKGRLLFVVELQEQKGQERDQ